MLNLKCQNLDIGNLAAYNTFSKSFIFQKDKNFPYLFLILNVNIAQTQGSKIASILSEIANLKFFEAQEKEKTNVSKNFEQMLNKINQALATLAEHGHIEWINKLHLAISVISPHSIQFTYTGNIKILLFREGNLINLAEQTKNTTKQKPIKIFTDIVSGTLQKNDKLIFGTSGLFDYFSEEKLKRTIIGYPPDLVCKKLKAIFLEKDLKEPFSAIFAEISGSKPSKSEKTSLSFAYPNLADLEEKSQATASKKEDVAAFLTNRIKKTLTYASQSLRPSFLKIKNFILKKPFFALLNNLFIQIKKKQKIVYKSKFHTPITSFSKEWESKTQFKLANFINQIKNKIINLTRFLFVKFNKLPKSSKFFFITSLIFGLAFAVSVGVLLDKQKKAGHTTRLKNLLAEAREKEKMAEDALIYQDLDKANRLLSEAKSILENEISIESEDLKNERDVLLAQINAQFDKVDKIIRIKEPIILASPNKEKMEIKHIVGLGENLYSYDPNTNLIYQLDETAKQFVTISHESTNIGYFKLASTNSTKNSIIFLTDSPALAEFDLETKELNNLDISQTVDQKIKDMKIYNDRLYLLTESNQIKKHSRTISGYSKGIEWLKESNNELNDVVSFAIDGAIYILKSNGQVLKFLNGKKQNFALSELRQPLDSPVKIFTLFDQEFIYILDPKKKRIVVFDKKGNLKNQYLSDLFGDLSDIYVNEKTNKIYLLCGQKVLGIVLKK